MKHCIALVAVGLLACKTPAKESAPPPPASGTARVTLSEEGVRNAEVRVQEVKPSEFAPRLTLAATVEPDPSNVARIGARVSGRLGSIDVRLGDTVKRDQQLASVETIEIHQTATEYMVALARAKEADEARERQKKLVDERVGALADLRTAEANAAAADATLRESIEHLHFLGLNDSAIASIRAGREGAAQYSVLRSPIAGQVTEINCTLGQVLGGSEQLFTVITPAELWLTMRVYERDAAAVRVGSKVVVTVPSLEGKTLDATVTMSAGGINALSRTMEVRARLTDGNDALRPGMSATATIDLPHDGKLWLPHEAIQPRGPERIAFIEVGERQYEARTVTAGAEHNGFVPVTSGLNEGDKLVVHGAFALRGELEREDEDE